MPNDKTRQWRSFPGPILMCVFAVTWLGLPAQKVEADVIRARVENYKNDVRGPYKDIRWFCPDGTTRSPQERCDKPGAVQRARMKDEVTALALSNHIFLGQILATTEFREFWDPDNGNSRLKQYQIERFLRAVDDGWILRKGQYYRGAYQAEDEEAWGLTFYQWLLEDDTHLQEQYFLIRQSAKDIPHHKADSKVLGIRALSKTIAEAYAPFMDLRVKIHGQPEAADIPGVIAFRDQHRAKLTAELVASLDQLIADMRETYIAEDLTDLTTRIAMVPPGHPLREQLTGFSKMYPSLGEGMSRAMGLAELMIAIREDLPTFSDHAVRLALLDISSRFEELFLAESSAWPVHTVSDALDKLCYSGLAATGAGYLEQWEWDAIIGTLSVSSKGDLALVRLQEILETGRAIVEWGTGMVRAVYGEVISLYAPFEPLVSEFQDDRIRSSALLPLGETVGILADVVAAEARFSNKVLGIANQESIRGLNPGYARGKLVVISGDPEQVAVSPENIYVFERPPSDLKPVAGIATVTEGNMVSHVQLLARNLGIPNAVISRQNLMALKSYSGLDVFYAVSRKGTVMMKGAEEMSDAERKLFAVKTRSEQRIRVPVDKIDLEQRHLLNLRTVNASHSGKLCGPKAANLGQLKSMFPQNVVEGIVIPFGVFRMHMQHPMQGQVSYWGFMRNTFIQAENMKTAGASQEETDRYVLEQLQTLRGAIQNMALTSGFVAELDSMFISVFGKGLGEVPVFLRSDTNMEDLKDFTGAGLNLTVFNVVDRDKILQGIRDVWGSPYSERSYKWRQSYLLNPENVFPSILIIPSVDVECSGVLITKGVLSGEKNDITVAFNRGAGGAVDGQAAESYVLQGNGGNRLLAPAREPTYRRLPLAGGTQTHRTTFAARILTSGKLAALRAMGGEIRKKLPGTPGIESQGPFDVELGFTNDGIWLFQVRPFVENKNALSSEYLESITPRISPKAKVNLHKPVR